MSDKPADLLGSVAEFLEGYPDEVCITLAAILRKAEKEYRSREGLPKWDDPNPNGVWPIDLTGSGLFDESYWELAYKVALTFREDIECTS